MTVSRSIHERPISIPRIYGNYARTMLDLWTPEGITRTMSGVDYIRVVVQGIHTGETTVYTCMAPANPQLLSFTGH